MKDFDKTINEPIEISSITHSELIPNLNKSDFVMMESGEYITRKCYEMRRDLAAYKGLKWLKANGHYVEYSA